MSMPFNLQYMVSFIVDVINPMIGDLKKEQLNEIKQGLEFLKRMTCYSGCNEK